MSQHKLKEYASVLAAGIGINIIAILFIVCTVGVQPRETDMNHLSETWLNSVVDGTSVFALLLFILWLIGSMIFIGLSRKHRWACKLHYVLLFAGICIGTLLTILGLAAPLFGQPQHIGLVLISPGLFLILASTIMLIVSRKQLQAITFNKMLTNGITESA